MIRGLLTDDEWAYFEPFLIRRAGRPPRNHRRVMDATFWLMRTGAPWRDLPEEFGNWNSIFRQFRLSVPKTKFDNNGGEDPRRPAPMRCGLRAGWHDGLERLCQETDEFSTRCRGSILRQDPAQVRFAQDNHMVNALATNRSDQPFGEAVLPWRAWGNRLVADPHGP